MLKALRGLFQDSDSRSRVPEREHRQFQLSVAMLLHESTRVDLEASAEEQAAAHRALADLFGLDTPGSEALLAEARSSAHRLTSYFPAVTRIKRDSSLEQRVRLVEHLWSIAYADGRLDPYEDHFVRKIAHLLYVPNTQCMLARSRARAAAQ